MYGDENFLVETVEHYFDRTHWTFQDRRETNVCSPDEVSSGVPWVGPSYADLAKGLPRITVVWG